MKLFGRQLDNVYIYVYLNSWKICRKEKSPQKTPKLPVKSPIKVQMKSPVKKSPEELPPLDSIAEVTTPIAEIPAQVVRIFKFSNVLHTPLSLDLNKNLS
jgi:hypothetical protein